MDKSELVQTHLKFEHMAVCEQSGHVKHTTVTVLSGAGGEWVMTGISSQAVINPCCSAGIMQGGRRMRFTTRDYCGTVKHGRLG